MGRVAKDHRLADLCPVGFLDATGSATDIWPDAPKSSSFLARLSHLEGIFCLRARKFLLLSTSALRKSAKTSLVKTLPLFWDVHLWHAAVEDVSAQYKPA